MCDNCRMLTVPNEVDALLCAVALVENGILCGGSSDELSIAVSAFLSSRNAMDLPPSVREAASIAGYFERRDN